MPAAAHPTSTVVVGYLGAPVPMGQQAYERHLVDGLLGRAGDPWALLPLEVTPGWRGRASRRRGAVRLPGRVIEGAPSALRRAVGSVVFRGADLVHRLDLRLPPSRAPEVLTVLDLACHRFRDEGALAPDAKRTARRAAAVLCPSEFAAEEVSTVFGVRRIEVVFIGVDGAYLEPPGGDEADGAVLSGLGIRHPYVLHKGGCTQRKNLGSLAEAWSRLAPGAADVSLVLCGPPDARRSRAFAHLPRTRLAGWVSPAEAVVLTRNASAVVVPSTYEGFGLPALEGLACGVPVVASDRSSLREVCGADALLVEPTAEGIAAGLEAALQGGQGIAAMAARGPARAGRFRWDDTVARHAQVYRRVLDAAEV